MTMHTVHRNTLRKLPTAARRPGPIVIGARRAPAREFRCAPAPRMGYGYCWECECKGFRGSGQYCGNCGDSFYSHY